MPSSDARSIQPVLDAAWESRPASVIDAGAGRGKYGLLLREYLSTVRVVDAIEVWPDYVSGAGGHVPLANIYDTVHTCPIQQFAAWSHYDLALIIDVLEHLPHHQGVRLIDKITEAGCGAVICTPRSFFQNPEWHDVPSEKHRSLWRPTDFDPWGALDRSTDRAVIVRIPPR